MIDREYQYNPLLIIVTGHEVHYIVAVVPGGY
jgi:hypothetical protein